MEVRDEELTGKSRTASVGQMKGLSGPDAE
jgi:hypothetical protein